MKHIICDGCGKNSDGLMRCENMGQVEYLCPDCMEDSGYCYGCGPFCAGITSFDFSPIDGYCEICVDEIESNTQTEYEEDEDYDPNDSRNL